MTKAHKNAEVIKAWADGKAIQWPTAYNEWIDFDEDWHSGPWNDYTQVWRIKPEPKKGWVRVAEHKDPSGNYITHWSDKDALTDRGIETCETFLRWLSPRFDFDYPEDYESV